MEPSIKEAFELYESGKHRRYGLLFSVNGGAFAIAQLLTDKSKQIALGDLGLSELSLGMMAFTAVMTGDIFAFGSKMRKNYLHGAFDWRGKLVLLLLGFLLIFGWYLAGRPYTLFI